MRYLLDTNIFRGLTSQAQGRDGAIRPETAERAKAKLNAQGDQFVGSIETMYELIAHIRPDEKDMYDQFREALDWLLKCTDQQVLEHADRALQIAVTGKPIHPSVVAPAIELCKYLVSITRFVDLESFRDMVALSPAGIQQAVLTHCELIGREHEKFKLRWALDHITGAMQTYWSDYAVKRLSGQPAKLKHEDRVSALKDLEEVRASHAFAIAIATRAGFPEQPEPAVLKEIENRLCAYRCAHYELWGRAIRGYAFEGHMNDMVDLLLLMHLVEDDVTLVTNDGRLKNLLSPDCSQYGRVMSFQELADSLGV